MAPTTWKLITCLSLVIAGAFGLPSRPLLTRAPDNLKIKISVADGLLTGKTDGRVMVLIAPAGTDPFPDDTTDVTSAPSRIFGKNVYGFGPKATVTLAGGNNDTTLKGVYGWTYGSPNVSLNTVPAGLYSIQAYMTPYDTATRSDGSVVSVHFPCGDGAPSIDGVGSLYTPVINVTITGATQTIALTFSSVEPPAASTGTEIGGCSQGNYPDTDFLKHIKIRSKTLSKFWGRDMYVGANVVLPHGYNTSSADTLYPVIYSQGHWPAGRGPNGYGTNAAFTNAWNSGIIPSTNGSAGTPTPKLILVTFRHEAPFYDDSYAVNTANLGPYGDAINEELIPYLEKTFKMIPEPYARIQAGGSTGGWESIASLIFRPDLFGACFTSYPDSLDFHFHQDIHLYDAANAYVRPDGSSVGSIRTFSANGTEIILATVADENHWELSQGTSSRSFLQWDIWQAVFSIQGLNNYPLEAWDKVTGEIYPDAVEYWKPMDLSNHVTTNWNNSLNLGEALRGRVYIYVGSWDTYYLNEGVMAFQAATDALGGAGWANVTILAHQPHGGNYQLLPTWSYIQLVYNWIQDHGPNGTKPLSSTAIAPSGRSNKWADVIKYGGHQAALARQAPPSITGKNQVEIAGQVKVPVGSTITGTVGRWDPGVTLVAQWLVNGQPSGKSFKVMQNDTVAFQPPASTVQLAVTGSKRYYTTETRTSKSIVVGPKSGS